MKKKIISGLVAVCVIVAAIFAYKFAFGNSGTYVKDPSATEVQKAFDTLNNAYIEDGTQPEKYYTDFIADSSLSTGEGKHIASVNGGISTEEYYQQNKNNENVSEEVKENSNPMKELDYQDVAQYDISVEKSGLYYLYLDYTSVGSTMSNYTVSVKIDGEQKYNEMNTISLPLTWKDKDVEVDKDGVKTFPLDSHNDEMAPSQEVVKDWNLESPLYNNTYTSTTPLCFYLEEGVNTIEIENVSSGGLAVGDLVAAAAEDDTDSYEDYAKSHSNEKHISDEDVQIDAVYYDTKNTTSAIYGTSTNSSLTRFNIDYEKLNTLGWSEAGAEVTYKFNVAKTGNYNLAFHYKNEKKEFSSFETIKIDGKVPFTELENYQFPYVASGWDNLTLADEEGTPYEIYLTEGEHTITIKQENQPVMEAYRDALLIEQHLTDFELEITKITGTNIDKNRKWKMTKYIPEIKDYLDAYETLIQHIRFLLQDYSDGGNDGAVLTYLDQAEVFIKNISKYPDEIALHKTDLTGAENSILKSMSNFTTEVVANSITLDRIYVYGDKSQLGANNSSAGGSLWVGIKSLMNTFTSSKYSTDIEQAGDDVLTIWYNGAITHVDLLQKMADTQFTPQTGIKVKIATMPDVNKLTLAIAADKTPDMVLGLASYVPFDLSSRGALYDMTQFDDFWSVSKRFPTGSFVSYVYNEGVYAIPERTDFNVIAYRTDIFDNLGIQVPDTWDDLIEILPTLQRYGMNFYHNISLGTTGYKWFYQTAPMILQNGGQLYKQNEDGIVTTGIDTKESVKGLQVLGDLFTKYSLDTSVQNFFNSFRYSTLPIGIIGMEDYTLINNGAQELEGQWDIAPYIGTKRTDENGNEYVDRTFVANGSGASIFKSSNKKEQAWKFLKWWTSQDVQVEYTNTLRSTYGKTYFWLSANIEALKANPMDEADKQVILNQMNYVTDVTRTPGQYLLERTISNIWTTMVFDGTAAQVAVDEAKVDVNREIIRKMQELGYYDEDEVMVKKFKLQGYDWIKENQDAAAPEKEE